MSGDILCAIDFTEASEAAIRWSVALARQLKTHLTLLHAYRLNKGHGEGISLKRSMEREAMTQFERLENTLLKNQGISYDFKTEVGFVTDRIELHTKTRPVQFLVMDRSVQPDVLDKLVSTINVPLVIVPQINQP